MQRVFGDKKRIDLSSSEFRTFVENGRLYVDKTRFIEHVLEEDSRIMLFTRPRRTGKSLNLDMLRTFLDCQQDTRELFRGLYIEGSPVFEKINSRPVIYMNFKMLKRIGFEKSFWKMMKENTKRLLCDSQVSEVPRQYLAGDFSEAGYALYSLTENIHEAYGIKPYVLIDEYDKPLMDNISASEYEAILEWLKGVFESVFKDNHHVERGIMVGVTRVSQEGLLSGLNNVDVFDVFRQSAFDGDFSLTEEEVVEILIGEQIDTAREWYNNYRVGDEKLYTLYSVLTYAKIGILGNYWGMSGSIKMLIDALDTVRADAIANLLSSGRAIETGIARRMSLRQLRSGDMGDSFFYSFAVQAGYLTYDRTSDSKTFSVHIPNRELSEVWEEFILDNMLKGKHRGLRDIFKHIADTKEFSRDFQEFVSFQLSSYDIGKELEKTYHVLVFGLILGAGYKCNSNRERGYGRYDLWLEGPDFNVIIEFKRARKETEDLEELAGAAIGQIDRRKYYAKFPPNVPLYKVGVGCFRAECFVKTELHDFGASGV